MQLNIKINQPILKKWAEELNRHLSQQDIEMACRHMKKYLRLLIIRKMQIKAIGYFTPDRMVIITKKKKRKNKCCHWCGEKETLVEGLQISAGTMEKIMVAPKIIIINRATIQPNNYTAR